MATLHIEIDVRLLNDKIDSVGYKSTSRIGALDGALMAKLGSINQAIDELKVGTRWIAYGG